MKYFLHDGPMFCYPSDLKQTCISPPTIQNENFEMIIAGKKYERLF